MGGGFVMDVVGDERWRIGLLVLAGLAYAFELCFL